MIRPEQVRLVPPGVPGSVRARVSNITFYGHDAIVRLTLPKAPGASVSARLFGQDVPTPGQQVGVAIEGEIMAYPNPVATSPQQSAKSR